MHGNDKLKLIELTTSICSVRYVLVIHYCVLSIAFVGSLLGGIFVYNGIHNCVDTNNTLHSDIHTYTCMYIQLYTNLEYKSLTPSVYM